MTLPLSFSCFPISLLCFAAKVPKSCVHSLPPCLHYNPFPLTPVTVHMTLLKLLIILPNDLLMPSSVLTYLGPITLGFCAAFNILDNSFLLGVLGVHDFSLSSLIIHFVCCLLVSFLLIPPLSNLHMLECIQN